MKKSSLLWILLMAAGFGIVEMHSVMANKTGPTPSGATAKANPFRMTVDQAMRWSQRPIKNRRSRQD